MAHRSPWRSEPLEFVEFILPEDLCREALYELGDLRMVQFVDENEVHSRNAAVNAVPLFLLLVHTPQKIPSA